MTLRSEGKTGFHAPAPRADHGPRERWQHAGRVLEVAEQAGVLAARVAEENGLDHLLAAGAIDALMHEAGLILRADYQAANLESRVIASYSAVRGGLAGGYIEHERSEAEERAYQRWRLALKIAGMFEGRALISACCQGQIPATSAGLHYLRRGLSRLADHYGVRKS